METSHVIVLLFCIAAATGSEVALGILGTPAFIECQLPVSTTLIWEIEDGAIIAINGKLLDDNSTKYSIQKQSGFRESLVIHDVTLADDKKYQCRDVRNKSAVENTKLNVLVRPWIMDVERPEHSVIEGMMTTLSCMADGAKPLPEIRWYHKDIDGNLTEVLGDVSDVIYPNTTGRRVNTLHVNVTRDLYMTSFVCNTSVSVFYEQMFIVDMEVSLAPQKPTVVGYDGSFDPDVPQMFECVSNGSRPIAAIQWYIDGHRLGDFDFVVIPRENGTFDVKSTLSQTLSRDFDGSVLTCAVTNKVLEARNLPALKTHITLRASYKPKVSVETSSITSREGDNVTLRCDIDAVPTVTSAYWLFKGAVVDRHYSNMTNDSTTLYLVHENIRRADAGDYTCHVQNRIGVATSSPVAITVQYAPMCSSGRRYAVSLGSRVSIACHMTGSPSNVTLTWRLAVRNVTMETSSAENNRAFGVLEYIPRSPRDYGVLECYGKNSVGVSSSPCLFDIVPPGPPQVPENCSTITNGNDVSIHCEPGFNGGSSQHFLLKILKINNYETVFRNDIAAFNIQAYENMTVRICAENIDYPRLEVCASPMEILVFNEDQGTSGPVLSSPSSKASRIAGGVTAAIGVVVIAILIVALLWRYRKDASHGQFTAKDIEDIEDNTDTGGEPRNRRFISWLNSKIKSRFIYSRNDPVENTRSSPTERDAISIATIEDCPVYSKVVRLSSTPHQASKHKIQRDVYLDMEELQIEIPSHYVDSIDIVENTPPIPDVMYERTGVAMSPISCQLPSEMWDFTDCDECVETRRVQMVNETTDAGLSNFYNTADIIEGLSECDHTNNVRCSHLSASPLKDSLAIPNTFRSVRNYSTATLEQLFRESSEIKRHLSEELAIESSFIDVETDDICPQQDGNPTQLQKYIEQISVFQQDESNETYRAVPTMTGHRSLIDFVGQETPEKMRKSYSLPYRKRLINSEEHSTEENIHFSLPTANRQNIHFIKPTVVSPDKSVRRGQSVSRILQDGYEEFGLTNCTITEAHKSKNDRQITSHTDSDAESDMCDIDNCTLVTSEGSEKNDDDEVNGITLYYPGDLDKISELHWDLSENSPIIIECEPNRENDDTSRVVWESDITNNDCSTVKRSLRSDSFLEAVTGDVSDEKVKSFTDETRGDVMMALPEPNADSAYSNCGYVLDEDDISEGINITETDAKSVFSPNVDLTAFF